MTMPRVKALTTGSIPSFLDMILNFAESDTTSSLANQDTWIAQMKATEKGRLVMYGDDTWLKLFPNTFARADGTSSFFVSVGFPRVTMKLWVLTLTLGLHRSGQQCDETHTRGTRKGRLECHDHALPRHGPHWPQVRSAEVRPKKSSTIASTDPKPQCQHAAKTARDG